MMYFGRLLCVGFLVTSILSASGAPAATLRVSPTRIDLTTDGKAAAVRIQNSDSETATLQVVTKPWGEAGEANSQEFAIMTVPPIFTLEPGEEQVVRLAARGLEDEVKERAFVLLFKQVPGDVQADGSGLAFLLNVELPLFVTPPRAEPNPIWTIKESIPGHATLLLTNAGNAHLRLDELTVHAALSEQPFFSSDHSHYAFAGEEASWPLDIDLGEVKGPITIGAQTNIGPIETSVSFPDG